MTIFIRWSSKKLQVQRHLQTISFITSPLALLMDTEHLMIAPVFTTKTAAIKIFWKEMFNRVCVRNARKRRELNVEIKIANYEKMVSFAMGKFN